jgi:NADPH2:quinone reductase
MQATRVLGRIVNVGRLGGMKDSSISICALRRISIGVTFRTVRSKKCGNQSACRPTSVSHRQRAAQPGYSSSTSAAALAHMRENKHFGKVIPSVGA